MRSTWLTRLTLTAATAVTFSLAPTAPLAQAQIPGQAPAATPVPPQNTATPAARLDALLKRWEVEMQAVQTAAAQCSRTNLDKTFGSMTTFDGVLKFMKPDLVMVEFPRKRQSDLDDRYAKYREGGLRDRRNEYVQVGMRLATALDHSRMAAIDVKHAFQSPEHQKLFEEPTPRLQKLGAGMQQKGQAAMKLMAERLSKDSIGDMLAWMNEEPMLQGNHDFYVDDLMRGWKGDNQGGAHTVANWYTRNILIFQNVLREVMESDGKVKRVVIVIGQKRA